MSEPIVTENQIKQAQHIMKWKRMSTVERTIELLKRKKETRMNQIAKARADIVKINRAINALIKCETDEHGE